MNDNFKISIPTDDDGYVLLKCPNCGTYFKVTPLDFQDDGVLDLRCPCCAQIGENYFTEDVIELAITITKNKVMDKYYDEAKKLERQLNNGPIKFKAGKPPKHELEEPIRSGIEALEIAVFPCCKRTAKIKPLLKITGCYCPFCGVKNYELE